jgi:hypothetical protein
MLRLEYFYFTTPIRYGDRKELAESRGSGGFIQENFGWKFLLILLVWGTGRIFEMWVDLAHIARAQA